MKKLACFLYAIIFSSCAPAKNENELVARQMFDAFNRHDWKAMAEHYKTEAEFLDPSYGTSYVTKTQQQIIDKYSAMQAMFPDIYDDVREVYSDGDKVIVEFVSTGSSGDSIKFSLPIISVLTIQDGKIIKDATYYDQ